MSRLLSLLDRMDRRVVFLMMGLAVAIPVLFPFPFNYKASVLAQSVFDEIERLPEGSKVCFSFDYDPGSEGEIAPMTKALLYHCGQKRVRLYFMALWGPGASLSTQAIDEILLKYFKDQYRYGDNYVEFGYATGNEGVIKVAVTDFRQMYRTDVRGTPVEKIPMMDGVQNLQAMDLLISVSSGYPGSKEWIQYFVGAYPNERVVTGTTGVQSVSLYPYIPQQLRGMLGAIKGAAEYESIVNARYPGPDGKPIPELGEGRRRMGPQLTAHLLMIVLIILGNIVYLHSRSVRRRAEAAR